MKSSLRLGTVSGIKISVHWTFIILLAWILLGNYRAGADVSGSLWSVLFILSIFVCVIVHELGHALTAKRFGINTQDITLYPIGGIARLDSIPKKPREELLVALAGPAVNLVIAFMLLPFADLSSLEPDGFTEVGPENFLLNFAVVNIWLAVFNLIPAFPMDGGRVFRALLVFKMNRVRATKIAATVGQVIALGFVFFGFYINPFLIFIGLFIFLSAQSESNLAQTEELIEGHSLLELTMKKFPTISISANIDSAIHEVLDSQSKNFLVRENGNIVGVLGQTGIINALRNYGPNCSVGKAMDAHALYLDSSISIEDALKSMQQESKSAAIILDQGHVIGMVDRDNILEFILFQSAKKDSAAVSAW